MAEIFKGNAPAVGPYSPGLKKGELLFISGQMGLLSTGELISDEFSSQATQALENIKFLLEEAGYSLHDVVKTTVFLKSIDDFSILNEIYSKYFTAPYPARSAVQVSALPRGAKIEIEAIALKEE